MRTVLPLTITLLSSMAFAVWCVPVDAHAFSLPEECSPDERAIHATRDTDGDGLTDDEEYCVYYTNPSSADTDSDGHSDKMELDGGFSPHVANARLIDVDSDEDYLNDDWELRLGTGIMNPDSDGDLYLDGTEVAASFDPRNSEPVQLEKLIRVDDAGLSLTYSMGDIVLGTIPVSTGKSWTPTPHGEFEVLSKIHVKPYIGPTWNYPNTYYNLYFTTWNGWRYYIHGAYWHNKFGVSPVSGGCVNGRYEDMEHLYWWAQYGTKIIIE